MLYWIEVQTIQVQGPARRQQEDIVRTIIRIVGYRIAGSILERGQRYLEISINMGEVVHVENNSPMLRDSKLKRSRPTEEDEEEGQIPEDRGTRPTLTVVAKHPPPVVRGHVVEGVYMPPAKRRMLEQRELATVSNHNQPSQQDSANTNNEIARQRQTWNDQKRVIHGTINRLNLQTIKPLVHDLFAKVNLVRLRGVLAKSILQAAVSAPSYNAVYAALVAVLNTKLPEVGELVTIRAILAFRRHFRRREKTSCVAMALFLGHLFHQAVTHELLILQILTVLLDGDPTDDSVQVAVQLLSTTGYALLEVTPAGVRAVLERLRGLLHEGSLSSRVEYQMETLLKLRKEGFRSHPPIPKELDLVEQDDQITFEISLDDEDLRKQEELDVFAVDPEYAQNETEWGIIRAEILGLGSDDDEEEEEDSSSGESGDEDGAGDDNEGEFETEEAIVSVDQNSKHGTVVVQDLSEADLVHLRRTIYLTIMSSATFEECAHKLAKVDIPDGREEELINMLIECCSQERTFLRYYGLIASRFCLLHDRWKNAFMDAFAQQYTTIHRLETNKLRNVAKLFAHLLHTDSMPWSVLAIVRLNEDETTSSSRIFVKILVQEMAEALGIASLKERLETDDLEMAEWFKGMFPRDNVRNTRYAINFFTSIGLGPLTDGLREFLKNAPKLIMQQAQQAKVPLDGQKEDDSSVSSSSSSDSESSSSLSSSSSSSSGSYSSYLDNRREGRSRGRRRRDRSRSHSQSSRSASSRSSYSRSSSRSLSRFPSHPKNTRGAQRRRPSVSSRDSRRYSSSSSATKQVEQQGRSRSVDSFGRERRGSNAAIDRRLK